MIPQFDPITTVADWFEAYRSGAIDSVVDFHADDMMLECGCDGEKTIIGKTALAEYWRLRLANADCKPSQLEQIWLEPEGAALEYRTPKGLQQICFRFNACGKIAFASCRPRSGSQATPQIQPE